MLIFLRMSSYSWGKYNVPLMAPSYSLHSFSLKALFRLMFASRMLDIANIHNIIPEFSHCWTGVTFQGDPHYDSGWMQYMWSEWEMNIRRKAIHSSSFNFQFSSSWIGSKLSSDFGPSFPFSMKFLFSNAKKSDFYFWVFCWIFSL